MKTFTKKTSDKIMLENLEKMADKKHYDYFTNIKNFGKSTPTAKALLALNLIGFYKGDSKKYVWIANYPTENTVILIKNWMKQNDIENQKKQEKQKIVTTVVETLNIDTDDFDKNDDKNDSDIIPMGPAKYKIVEKKGTCHNTVSFSHWLFSNCNLDVNQVTDIIDTISSNNNKSETILNLVVKYKIPISNIDYFASECKKFN